MRKKKFEKREGKNCMIEQLKEMKEKRDVKDWLSTGWARKKFPL